MTGDVSFVSIGVREADRARRFYGALFGWKFSEPPSGRGAVIDTANVGGGIHGDDPGASPYVFFEVDDIEVAAARVRELGGEAEPSADHDETPESVARFGRFMLCRDDQGSVVGLHQPPRP